MKRVLVLVVGLAGLVFAAPAAAKEIEKVQICGPSACATLKKPSEQTLFSGGHETTAPPVSAFYRLKVFSRAEEEEFVWSTYYVPSSGMLRNVGEAGEADWYPLGRRGQAILRKAAAQVQPFPAPTLSSVRVGNRRISGDPNTYLLVYSLPATDDAVPQEADWMPIWLTSTRPSPWTDGRPYVYYSPSANLIQRGAAFAKVPSGLAADIEAARTLNEESGSTMSRLLAAAIAAALALVAAAAVILALRRRRTATAVGEVSPA